MPSLAIKVFKHLILSVSTLVPVWGVAPELETPRVWLWAWDRPEDLRFLRPADAGVAFFVLGIRMGENGLSLRPRTAPLRLTAGMHRIAVVRLEMTLTNLSENQMNELVSAIREKALVPGIEGIQLDFDAALSQRPFYRRLLARLRSEPALHVPISITALASWCMGDRWIRNLPVDSAVAMLFQMGPSSSEALAWLRKERPLAGLYNGTLAWGLSTDQPLPVSPPIQARVFFFHPHPWTPSAFKKALHLVSK